MQNIHFVWNWEHVFNMLNTFSIQIDPSELSRAKVPTLKIAKLCKIGGDCVKFK